MGNGFVEPDVAAPSRETEAVEEPSGPLLRSDQTPANRSPAREDEYESLPLDVLLDSEPDTHLEVDAVADATFALERESDEAHNVELERPNVTNGTAVLENGRDEEYEVVDVSEADIVAPEGEPDSETAAEAPQVEGSAGEGVREERQDAGGQDELQQPFHSTRSSTPGVRGCWALNKAGDPCGAGKRADSDFCNAHSGIGVSADPSGFAPLAHEAKRRNAEVRASMRLALGNSRMTGPRAALRAHAFAEAERLARRTVSGALEDPRLALAVIREVDPAQEVTVSVEMPTDPAQLAGMGIGKLMALAERYGIEPVAPLPASLPASD